MLTVSDLSKSFNIQTLFEKITFSLNPGERVGLIGPNGCGKTTLLRILAGREEPTSGSVHHPSDLRIGYLPQGFELDGGLSIRQAIGMAVGDPAALEGELASTAQALAQNLQDRRLSDRYDELLRRLQTANPGEREAMLASLGLAGLDQDMPAARLSGGQRTRLALALVLLSDPDILLLDEPTNHLDVEMLEWLEGWLKRTPVGALIVSHDRVFLDHTVTRILEMDIHEKSLRAYEGNYSDFLEKKRGEKDKQWSQYRDQQLEIRRMKADIARVKEQAAYTERQSSSVRIGGPDMKISGAKDYLRSVAKKVAKKAKSREKKLERYQEADERLEKPAQDRALYFEFQKTNHLGRSVLQLEDLSVGYDQTRPLLQSINLQVQAGQRIVVSGPNGCGKTSLLRTVMGVLPPLTGRVLLGSSVRIGIMSQDLSSLPAEQTPVECVGQAFPNQTKARRYLASYLLAGDEVLKPVKLLSYGQRARLELAQLILNGCNLLLLDEPINHLDIPSRTQFELALDQFKGAVLAVVHDRYFIERFAEQVWMVEDRRIRIV
ncbi:MAG: ABC-F family ATP-binding cassette domain-containing protein [Anaerolineae bacterium]|nr:ABC-F family ATP-binding cassette domain-containing protein [Anaerolineae bacterium]